LLLLIFCPFTGGFDRHLFLTLFVRFPPIPAGTALTGFFIRRSFLIDAIRTSTSNVYGIHRGLTAEEAGTEVATEVRGEIEVAAIGNFLGRSSRSSRSRNGSLRSETTGGSRRFGSYRRKILLRLRDQRHGNRRSNGCPLRRRNSRLSGGNVLCGGIISTGLGSIHAAAGSGSNELAQVHRELPLLMPDGRHDDVRIHGEQLAAVSALQQFGSGCLVQHGGKLDGVLVVNVDDSIDDRYDAIADDADGESSVDRRFHVFIFLSFIFDFNLTYIPLKKNIKGLVYTPVSSGYHTPQKQYPAASYGVYLPIGSGSYTPFRASRVYNPVISGWCIPQCKVILSWLLVYNPVISGWCIPSTGIQFPKVLVVASDPTNQPTEYSCFHDDHASPQALIPAIPSVLVFISLAMCAIIAHFICSP
jgi:hypothetical protein